MGTKGVSHTSVHQNHIWPSPTERSKVKKLPCSFPILPKVYNFTFLNFRGSFQTFPDSNSGWEKSCGILVCRWSAINKKESPPPSLGQASSEHSLGSHYKGYNGYIPISFLPAVVGKGRKIKKTYSRFINSIQNNQEPMCYNKMHEHSNVCPKLLLTLVVLVLSFFFFRGAWKRGRVKTEIG